MPRLITGEFNDRAAAESAIDALVAAGVPREQIYIETELPPDPLRGRKGGEVARAERERRIAGTETGALTGAIWGLLGGVMVAMMSYVLVVATKGESGLTWPFNSFWLMGIMGLIIGTVAGGALGASLDYTLNQMGAGPAKPREECLITVRTDDQGMEMVRSVFFNHRARHVLGAEMTA